MPVRFSLIGPKEMILIVSLGNDAKIHDISRNALRLDENNRNSTIFTA